MVYKDTIKTSPKNVDCMEMHKITHENVKTWYTIVSYYLRWSTTMNLDALWESSLVTGALLDGYMSAIGMLVFILNFVGMLVMFERKYKLYVGIPAWLAVTFLIGSYRRWAAAALLYDWKGLPAFFYLVLFLWYLKGSGVQKVFAFCFQWITTIALWYLAESITVIFVSVDAPSFTRILFFEMLVIYGVYTVLMVKFSKQLMNRLLAYGNRLVWMLYSAGAVYSFVFLTISRDFPGSLLQYIMLIIFVLWGFVTLCIAIINTHEKTRQKHDAEFARSIVSSGRGHYQKMNGMYDKLRILRHDFKYHLIAVREMLRSGDAVGADTYLTQVESQLSEYHVPKYCSNAVLNALIGSYAERCIEMQIPFTVHMDISEFIAVPDYDMCIVLGNLLENAIEASAKIEHRRFIELEAHVKSVQLVVMVKNRFDGVINEESGSLISVKINGGFGLRSVREVTVRHNGDLLTEWKGDVFTAYAALYYSRQQRP
jgi:hypothetical protein